MAEIVAPLPVDSIRLLHQLVWWLHGLLAFGLIVSIPFTKAFRSDMEVWHWRECDVAYASTAYFYARPGATTTRRPRCRGR